MLYAFACIYFFILAVAGFMALIRFQSLHLPARWVCGFIWLGVLTELAGWYAVKYYGTNVPVYNVSSLLELLVISLYFNFLIPAFRRRHLGIWIGMTGAAAGLLFLVLSGSIGDMNASFLFVECLLIAAMAMYALVTVVISDVKNFKSISMNFDLWIPIILAFYQFSGLSIWGLSTLVGQERVIAEAGGVYWLIGTNILIYTALVVVLLLYPKMKLAYEQ